ncbi:MAG TPA: NlpC/P60 family protein [Prolixibacteraceae bacterium]|nr:NlpC/P60 family protein [Prolixibacteraceae bacterium]
MYLQRIFILLIATVALLFVSCSKKQIPVSSKKYNAAIASAEMQAFAKGGVERDLKTGRKKPKKIIKTAEKYLGTPHCMGGTSKKCLDCSGLTYISFAKNKIEIPRNSQEQARYGRLIFDRNDLKRGDLVFFTRSYKTSDYVTHVGIYLGKGMFIHASSSAGVTKTALTNSWWSERFVFGTRVF